MGLDWITYQFVSAYVDAYLDSFFSYTSETANQRFNVDFFGHVFNVLSIECRSKHIVIFQQNGISVFELIRNRNLYSTRQYSYKFSFYGAYFYLDDLADVLLAFTKRYADFMTISRLDIALDCNIPIPVLYKRKKTQFQQKKLHINAEDVLTGFYLGVKKGNKKFLVRVYDKKLDSKTKEKFQLFLPYLMEETVSRIEAELHVLVLRNFKITPNTIIEYEEARLTYFAFAPNCMEQFFASLCMNEQGTYFKPLKGVDFAKVERLTTAVRTKRSEYILNTIPYIKDWLSRGLTLHKMKLNPLKLLEEHLKPKPPMEPSLKLIPYTDSDF